MRVETMRQSSRFEGAREGRARLVGSHFLPLVSSWALLSVVVVLSLFIFYMTFVPGLPTSPGWTLNHWTSVARPYVIMKVIPNTVIVGFGTVLIAVFFAAPLAWLLNRTSLPFRNLFMTLIAVVVIVPGFVKAMGWIMLLNPKIGLINRAIAGLLDLQRVPLSVSNPYGMAWVMGLMLTPTLFFLISGPMRMLDPALEEAATVVGANRWRTLWRVSLPLVWPGVLGGSIYIFMTAISIFEVPAMLGAAGGQSPVLASELFYAVNPASPETADEIAYGAAGVYGALIAAPSLVALYFYHRLLAKAHRYEVITGKGYKPAEVDLGRFKYLALGFILLYLVLAVVMPLLVLVWASLLPYLQMPSFEALTKLSLNNYRDLLPAIGGPIVIYNTIVLVVSVSVLVLFFSFMTSWIVVRTRIRWRRSMDTIAMLPHAIPGIAFAFAMSMLGIYFDVWLPWLPLTGTLIIIVICHLVNRLSYGTRITNAALLQIQSDLEDSAHVCGANNITTMWRIIVPLVKSSLVFACLWTALLTFREVSMALFLAGSKNMVISVGTWILWRQGELTTAAAAAVVMVGVLGMLLILVLGVGGGRLLELRQGGMERR